MATPPSTGYAVKSVTAGALLTDWTSLAMNMPAEWWALVDTSDGTKGRVFLDDGTTRLAVDPMFFDNVAVTSHFRFLIPTFSGVVPTTIRIYPPVAANDSVASGDLYGSFNARDPDWVMHLGLDEAVNNNANGYVDRTSNANHGTGVSMALPAVDGQVGKAQDFDGNLDYIDVGSGSVKTITGSMTLSYWQKGRSSSSLSLVAMGAIGPSPNRGFGFGPNNSGNLKFLIATDGSTIDVLTSTASTNPSVWEHWVAVYVDGGSPSMKIYKNGSLAGTLSSGLPSSQYIGGNRSVKLGNQGDGNADFLGLLDDVHIHSAAWSADEVDEEHRQADDNPAYWGVWDWNANLAPATFDIILADTVYIKQVAADTANILQVASDTVNIVQVDSDTVRL